LKIFDVDGQDTGSGSKRLKKWRSEVSTAMATTVVLDGADSFMGLTY
jgi:hypothetical protein